MCIILIYCILKNIRFGLYKNLKQIRSDLHRPSTRLMNSYYLHKNVRYLMPLSSRFVWLCVRACANCVHDVYNIITIYDNLDNYVVDIFICFQLIEDSCFGPYRLLSKMVEDNPAAAIALLDKFDEKKMDSNSSPYPDVVAEEKVFLDFLPFKQKQRMIFLFLIILLYPISRIFKPVEVI